MLPVFAAHISSSDISPEFSKASTPVEHIVSVSNDESSTDPIEEIRIKRPEGYSGLICNPVAGWGIIEATSLSCKYGSTPNNNIQPGQDESFSVITTTASSEGNYNWEIRTKDSVDQFKFSTLTTKIDATLPVISNFQPADGSFVSTATPTISASLSDTLSGIDTDSVSIEVNEVVVTDATVTASGVSFTPGSDLPEGVTGVTITASDVAGNSNSASFSFTVDTINPVVTVNSVDTPTKIKTQTITGTFTEANLDKITVGGGVAIIDDITYSAIVTLHEGDNPITIIATDKAGNTGIPTPEIPTINLDTTPPTTAEFLDGAVGDNGWFTSDVTVTLTCEDGPLNPVGGCATTEFFLNGVPGNYVGPFVISEEKSHEFIFFSVDLLGNGENSKTITVMIDKTPPVVDAGGDQEADEGDLVSFDGSGSSDLLSGIASYMWDFGDGNTGSGITTDHVYVDDGVYTATLTVTDVAGNSDSDSLTVTVNNVAPTASAGGPYGGSEGSEIQFTGTFSDPGTEDTHTFLWNFGDGATSTEQNPVHTYSNDEIFDVTFTVTDDGGSDTSTTTATVNNVAPTASAGGPYFVIEGSVLTLSGSATDPGADELLFEWDFDYGGSFNLDATGETADVVYPDDATVTVALRVSDDDTSSISTATVTVNNAVPEVDAVDDLEIDEGDTAFVLAAFADAGVLDTHTAAISWGDGTTTNVEAKAGTVLGDHVYETAGVFTVEITVTDDDGGSGSDTLTVTVEDVPPTVVLILPNGGEIFSGIETVEWEFSGPEVDTNTFEIELSQDGGSTFVLIDSTSQDQDSCSGNTCLIEWDTSGVPDSENNLIRVVATDDDGSTGEDVSDGVFAIDNTPPQMLSAETVNTLTIDVYFDETVEDAETADFSVSNGELQVGVTSVDVFGTLVRLTLDAQIGVDDTPTITLTGDGVADSVGNALTSGSVLATDGIVPPIETLNITLHRGWNFISTPKTLKNPDIDSVLSGVDFSMALEFNPTTENFMQPSSLVPLKGYWIKVNTPITLVLEFTTTSQTQVTVIPTLNLHDGWNAIGTTAADMLDAETALVSIDLDYSHLVGWDSVNQDEENAVINGLSSENPLSTSQFVMKPGNGFWVFVIRDTVLASLTA